MCGLPRLRSTLIRRSLGLRWHSSSLASHATATSIRPLNPRASTDIDPLTSYPVSRSRSSSVWTAPSPSQAVRSQSPSLPPLPRLAGYTSYLKSFESPGRHQRSESSAYYTALWGSPYDLPSSTKAQVGEHHHQEANSIAIADGSPSRSSRASVPRGLLLSTDYTSQTGRNNILGSSYVSRSLGRDSLPARSVSISDKPRYGFTQEWLETHLAQRKNDERGNWWSDDSGASDTEAGVGTHNSSEGASSKLHLDFEQDKSTNKENERAARTERSSSLCKANLQDSRLPHDETTVRHRALASDITLKQKDFDRIIGRFREGKAESAVIETSEGDVLGNLSAMDSVDRAANAAAKPLPPPPINRTVSEAPILTRALSSDTSATSVKRPSISTSTSFQRPRKRVVWRGKNCIIAMPLGDGISTPKKYSSADDAEARVTEWQKQGFNTRGFNLSEQIEGESLGHGQSREIYPNSTDWLNEGREKYYKVSIPNREAWDEYVHQLKEEKLRALGVSYGDGDLALTKSSDIPMSRQSTSQVSMMPLPLPLVSSSAASGRPQRDQEYSPLHPELVNSSNRPASVSTVIQQYPVAPGRPHMPNQSFSMNGHFFGAAGHFPSQQTNPPISNAWSHQQLYGSLPGSRGVSPIINGRRRSLQGTQSPVSPMPENAFDGYSTVHNNVPSRVSQQQTRPYNSQSHYSHQSVPQSHIGPHHAIPVKTSRERAHVLQPTRYVSQPEIASPLPQGHRQNLSESLQKEIDSAEYHLEESIRRQLDEDDEFPLHSTANNKSPLYPSLSHGSSQTNGSNSIRPITRTTMSDLDTNPSITGSPVSQGWDAQQIRPGAARLSHAPKVSVSKLNVNAREFVFDSQNTLTPSMFAFLGSSASSTASGSTPKVEIAETRSSPNTIRSSLGSRLNVAAPTFTPSGAQTVPIPSREFSFSSSMPRLKPDAPSFMPSSIKQNGGSASGQPGSDKPLARIFSSTNFPEPLKPGRKSKAIPIVKPDPSVRDNDSDDDPDNIGRITRAKGRDKRMRRTDDDEDQVPLFATPHIGLPPESFTGKFAAHDQIIVEPDTPHARVVKYDVRSSTDRAADKFDYEAEDSFSSESSGSKCGNEGKNEDEHNDAPFELNDAIEAASFNLARPMSSTSSRSPASGNESTNGAKHMDFSESVDHELSGHSSRNVETLSLSATVQPLEYNADVATYQSEFETRTPSDERKFLNGNLSVSQSLGQSEALETALQPLTNGSRRRRDTSSSARSSVIANGSIVYTEPSFQEIDTVMKHLNEDSDAGVERLRAVEVQRSPRRSPGRTTARSLEPVRRASSDLDRHLYAQRERKIPSSSPNRLQQPFQYLPDHSYGSSGSAAAELVARSARFSPSFKPQRPAATTLVPPIHRLNSGNNLPVSDWDDAVSSTEEAKIQSRSDFFDHRVNDLVGAIVQERLKPLESNLSEMGNSLSRLVSRSGSRRHPRSTSAEARDSDADDEDDDERLAQARARSPLKDRKYDKLKATLLEAVAAQQVSASNEESVKIMDTLAELKTVVEEQKTNPAGDIKAIVEEAINRHMRGKSAPIISSHQSATSEKYQLQLAGLESMLKISEDRAEDDLKARRAAEDELADCQRFLRLAQADAAEQRESAEETERSLREFHDERLQAAQRSTLLEVAQEDLQKTVTELSAKNVALEGTLEEYRLSSVQWRVEIDEAKSNNSNLDRTIRALKLELEDGIRGRQVLRNRFSSLQEEMGMVSRDIACDQSSWRYKEEEHKARHEWQNARLEAEARTRERLELEIQRLESQEKEAMKSRFLVEQVQSENGRLVALVNELRLESDQAKEDTARYQRESHDTKETGRLDMQRVQNAIEADTEKATQGMLMVRRDYENAIATLQTQLADAELDSANLKSRNELMLEEASESKDEALRLAAGAREAALREHYAFHERTLAEVDVLHHRALAAAIDDKDHALKNVLKDKTLTETHLKERLSLADEKIALTQDRVTHLEERLDIATAAAQAAVQAAQSARALQSPLLSRGPVSISRGSDVDAKISPQALRESILVLQEQLHERETQNEKLEQEIANVDKDAPTKIKDRDVEIAWLRELLGVRIDDLQDIITTLSGQTYDRDAARDAAIRLKANLQMEQQEKERAIAGGQIFPSLASISNLTASPRALPLAAVAAWGNWRKGQSTFASLSEMATGSPSRSSSQSFLSGLLTPPSTTLKQTPQPSGSSTALKSSSAEYRPLRGYSTPRQSTSRQGLDQLYRDQPPPKTPQLLRHASYDQDAQSGHYSLERYVAEDDASTADGHVSAEREEEPFGPNMAA